MTSLETQTSPNPSFWALRAVSAGVALPWYFNRTEQTVMTRTNGRVLAREMRHEKIPFWAKRLFLHKLSIWPPWGKHLTMKWVYLTTMRLNLTMIWVYLITMRQTPHDDLSLSDHHKANTSRWSESIWPPWGKHLTMIWVYLTTMRQKPHDETSLIQHPKDCKLLHLIAADLSRPQWKWAITDYEGCVGNQPVLRSIARLCFVRKTWRSLFGVFARNMNWPLHSVKIKNVENTRQPSQSTAV